jgi:hypothetical protein
MHGSALDTKREREMPGPPKHLYQDNLQLVLLALCVGDMAFFTYYFIAHQIPNQNTISDSLFDHGAYAVLLSVFLALRLLGVVLYLLRFRNENTPWVVAGFIGVCVTFVGW